MPAKVIRPKSKAASAAKGGTITTDFALEKETPGALRYQEVDAGGKPVKIENGAKIGTLYLRKSALPEGTIPKTLTVQINY